MGIDDANIGFKVTYRHPKGVYFEFNSGHVHAMYIDKKLESFGKCVDAFLSMTELLPENKETKDKKCNR
jgi:hypothetical protein